MRKKFLAVVLACAVLITATAAPAGADPSHFVIVDGVLTGYTGPGGHVEIPNGVTSIGNWAFANNDTITSVTIPNGVTSIGARAFQACTSLTSITIPDSVTWIGSEAFRDTMWFITQPSGMIYAGKVAYKYMWTMPENTTITLKEGTTGIASEAFHYQTNLTGITIPNSVKSIGNSAFRGCTSLTSIIIPNSVTDIGSSAFVNCTSLTSVIIPDSVTNIGESPFSGCTSLTAINVSAGNTHYTSIDGVLFDKDVKTLIRFPEGKTNTTYSIPNSVTSIGNDAFYYCESLTSVTIPDSVTSIGYSAFTECTSLTSIIIPDSVTSIGDGAFKYCTSLTSIIIPDSVTSIGLQAFAYCASLTSVIIGNGVTSIGGFAFMDCTSLTSVTFKRATPPTFEFNVFSGSNNLTTIYVPIGAKAAYQAIAQLSGFNIVEVEPPEETPEPQPETPEPQPETPEPQPETPELPPDDIKIPVVSEIGGVSAVISPGLMISIGSVSFEADPDKLTLKIEKKMPASEEREKFFTALMKFLS